MVFCASITREFLAHARVMAESLLACSPGSRLAVCIVDDPDRELTVADGVEVLSPIDLGMDRPELQNLAMAYDAHALASTMKPRLLRHLLGRGEESAILLDADICVYSSLEELGALAEAHGLVLSPHMITPMGRPDGSRIEASVVVSGTFNSGCLAVSAAALPFVDWWLDRVTSGCIVDPLRGFLLEQSWLALVPGLFPHHVLDSAAYNLQAFGLDQRDVEWVGDRPEIDGEPLRFFHFLSGFDPRTPDVLSPKAIREGWPGPWEPGPGVQRLARGYAERLLEAGWESRESHAYGALPDGTAIDEGMRGAYRKAVFGLPPRDDDAPPNPLDVANLDAFYAWLSEPPRGWPDVPVSRYQLAVHDCRADLRVIYDDVPGSHTRELLNWFEEAPGWGIELWQPPAHEAPDRVEPEQNRLAIEPSAPDDVPVPDWYHTIDLPDGEVIEGRFDLRGVVDRYGLPDSLEGKTVLDVATADGFFALELERRGAERVVAIDLPDIQDIEWTPSSREHVDDLAHPPRAPEVFKRAGSSVEYIPMNVYDLSPETLGVFDVVFCGSLLLHLRDPITALERIRSVTGELAIIETSHDPALTDAHPHAQWISFGAGIPEDPPGVYGVFFRPAPQALRRMCEYAGFADVELHDMFGLPPDPAWACVVHARPQRRPGAPKPASQATYEVPPRCAELITQSDAAEIRLQAKHRDLLEAQERLRELEAELAATRAELGAAQSQFEAIAGSRSWRMTAPLRHAAQQVRPNGHGSR